jgi:hypothetical protein
MTAIDLQANLATGLRASAAATAVRVENGAVVCSACGCRLAETAASRYTHYLGLPGRDARGCRVDCVDMEHRLA